MLFNPTSANEKERLEYFRENEIWEGKKMEPDTTHKTPVSTLEKDNHNN